MTPASNDECLLDDTLDAGQILADLSAEDISVPHEEAQPSHTECRKRNNYSMEKENANVYT